MTTRRERVIMRLLPYPGHLPSALVNVVIDAYEAELADLLSDETVERVALAIFATDQERRVEDARFSWAEAPDTTREFYQDDARAALKAAVNEKGEEIT